MRLASFDVGIKNLACCVFDVYPENNEKKIKIVYWNVINLLETGSQQELKKYCNFTITKTKKTCEKKAKYEINKDGQPFCFCENHAKKTNYILPCEEYSPTQIKKMKIEQLETIIESYNIPIEKETMSKINKKIILEKINEFFELKMLKKIIPKKMANAGNINLIQIGKNIKNELNHIECLRTTTHVLIENQISPIATRMKTIQGMLTQYFIMNNNDDITIEYISSSNKLKDFQKLKISTEQTNIEILSNQQIEFDFSENKEDDKQEKTKNTYKDNKKNSVLLCKKILENTDFQEWKFMLETNQKNDDKSDCFLQGMWYLKNKYKNII